MSWFKSIQALKIVRSLTIKAFPNKPYKINLTNVEKSGLEPANVATTYDFIRSNCKHLNPTGLMNIGSLDNSMVSNMLNQDFQVLKCWYHYLKFDLYFFYVEAS